MLVSLVRCGLCRYCKFLVWFDSIYGFQYVCVNLVFVNHGFLLMAFHGCFSIHWSVEPLGYYLVVLGGVVELIFSLINIGLYVLGYKTMLFVTKGRFSDEKGKKMWLGLLGAFEVILVFGVFVLIMGLFNES